MKKKLLCLSVITMSFLGIALYPVNAATTGNPTGLNPCLVTVNIVNNIPVNVSGYVVNNECCPKGDSTDSSCASLYNSLQKTETGITNLGDIFKLIAQLLFTVTGLALTGVIVYGGFTFLTASGDPEAMKKGQSILTYAFIGVAVIALSVIIIQIVSSVLGIQSFTSFLF